MKFLTVVCFAILIVLVAGQGTGAAEPPPADPPPADPSPAVPSPVDPSPADIYNKKQLSLTLTS